MSVTWGVIKLSKIIRIPQKHISTPIRLTKILHKKRPIVFLGAGASVGSGIPTTNELTEQIFKFGYWNENETELEYPEIKSDLYKPWLNETFDWYDEKKDNSNLYPLAVEYILKVSEERKSFFERHLLCGQTPPSVGYFILVELIRLNLVNTILTTNLDDCFMKTLRLMKERPKIHLVSDANDIKPIESGQIPPSTPKIIYLHGAIENYSDKNTPEEILSLDSKLINYVLPIMQDSPVIVIGYRGNEPSIMNNLFLNEKFKNTSSRLNFPHGIFWCAFQQNGDYEISPEMKKLSEKIGTNFVLIPISGFDNLMEDVIGPKFGIDPLINRLDSNN